MTTRKVSELVPYQYNPRRNDDAVKVLANNIKEFGFNVPLVIDKDNVIVNGHTRLKAAKLLGLKEVPVISANDLTDEQVKAYRLADNKVGELSSWDLGLLGHEIGELESAGFELADFGVTLADTKIDLGQLRVLPVTTLNSRLGTWQDRKRQWINLGIRSELGRDEELVFANNLGGKGLSGTSIFDPVLTELIYRWFTPDGTSNIIDPFSGGSVRGIVAKVLGHNYTGIDLRAEQIDANYSNARELNLDGINWINDDSLNMDKHVADGTQDLMIACPPYFDLEVYSDDENDISNMDFDGFTDIYKQIITKAATKLKDNRFAVVVITDVRDPKTGMYRDLQGLTKQAMADAGAYLYNDMILINSVGSASMRARKYMKYRKVARTHQNVLVFFKGDTKKIKEDFSVLQDLEEYLNELEE